MKCREFVDGSENSSLIAVNGIIEVNFLQAPVPLTISSQSSFMLELKLSLVSTLILWNFLVREWTELFPSITKRGRCAWVN